MAYLLGSVFFCFFLLVSVAGGAEPKIQISSPEDGARIVQEQPTVLLSGKVITQPEQRPNVDLFFVLDTSGSTALYAGWPINDPDVRIPPDSGPGRPQVTILGGGIGVDIAPRPRTLRNSVLVAEISATRRLLSRLNTETTRVGIITFAATGQVVQTLTNDFEQVKRSLDRILMTGPAGGTNMAEGIRQAIRELSGLGSSRRRDDAIKTALLLTDGVPTLPIGGGARAAPEDTQLAINAARLAGRAGIRVHAFALGQEALAYPRAAVGIAKESGGSFTPVLRPADVMVILESISVVGVDLVQVTNESMAQTASHLRLAADGFFSAAVPVKEGLNRLQVLARTNTGSIAQGTLTVHYQGGSQRSLEVEVFLDQEKNREVELHRLGKTREEIQRDIDRAREDALRQMHRPPPVAEER